MENPKKKCDGSGLSINKCISKKISNKLLILYCILKINSGLNFPNFKIDLQTYDPDSWGGVLEAILGLGRVLIPSYDKSLS